MQELCSAKCEACRVGAPTVTDGQLPGLLALVPDWEIAERDGARRLKRSFKFKNFRDALDFANRVGAIAEEEGHHPSLLTTWGRVTVTWWTHKINGLHRNDFIMAAKTDKLYSA